MPQIVKSIIGWGALVKNESSYAAGTSLSTATDGVQGVEPPVADIVYATSGERAAPPSQFGTLQYASPTGETIEGQITVEGRGLGSAYDSASKPPNIHSLLEGAGFTGSYASSTWTYTPVAAGTKAQSLGMEIYTRGEKFPVSGAFCDLSISTDGGTPLKFAFPFNGLPGTPSDVSLPSITYNTTLPPKAENISFTWNDITDLVIRSWNLDYNREIAPRMDLAGASGSAGFAYGRRAPVMSMTVEQTELSTWNPYDDIKVKTTSAFSLQIGSVQYNRYTVTGSAQLIGVTKAEDGPTATWDLEFALVYPDGTTDADLFFIFN